MLGRVEVSLIACCMLMVQQLPPAGAQSQDQVDRINKWFDTHKAPEWHPHVGEFQKPGAIQVPKGIQAIQKFAKNCELRMVIGADTLFEFDKSTLNKDAEVTLNALGPMLTKDATHPVTLEGHTDSIGGIEYNQKLSEKRAEAVRAWLVQHKFVNSLAQTAGFGKKRPIAPNVNPDGSDNPAGRQKNRRVEIVINTCSTWQQVAAEEAKKKAAAEAAAAQKTQAEAAAREADAQAAASTESTTTPAATAQDGGAAAAPTAPNQPTPASTAGDSGLQGDNIKVIDVPSPAVKPAQ